jgi:hypothetical protein
MGAGVGLIGAVGVATLLMILFRGSGRGPGAGPGNGPGAGTGAPTTQSMTVMSTPSTRPLKVTIQESNYVVGGRPLDLDAVADLATKVPSGAGPAVLVERSPTSRAKAENDLREALDKKGITHASD